MVPLPAGGRRRRGCGARRDARFDRCHRLDARITEFGQYAIGRSLAGNAERRARPPNDQPAGSRHRVGPAPSALVAYGGLLFAVRPLSRPARRDRRLLPRRRARQPLDRRAPLRGDSLAVPTRTDRGGGSGPSGGNCCGFRFPVRLDLARGLREPGRCRGDRQGSRSRTPARRSAHAVFRHQSSFLWVPPSWARSLAPRALRHRPRRLRPGRGLVRDRARHPRPAPSPVLDRAQVNSTTPTSASPAAPTATSTRPRPRATRQLQPNTASAALRRAAHCSPNSEENTDERSSHQAAKQADWRPNNTCGDANSHPSCAVLPRGSFAIVGRHGDIRRDRVDSTRGRDDGLR